MARRASLIQSFTAAGVHSNGEPFKITVTPAQKEKERRKIGASPSLGLQLIPQRDDSLPVTVDGSAAKNAKPGFEPLDRIVKVNGVDIKDFPHLKRVLAEKRNEDVTFLVKRMVPGKESDKKIEVEKSILVKPNYFRKLGLIMDVGEIFAIRKGSPADGKFQEGDKILEVAGKKIGESLDSEWNLGDYFDSLKLPDVFSQLGGQEVKVRVLRDDRSGGKQEVELTVVPDNMPPWTEITAGANAPLPISSIGVATYLTSKVIAVEPESPADKAGIKPGAIVKAADVFLPKDVPLDDYEERSNKTKFGDTQKNWVGLFWELQSTPRRKVSLTYSDDQNKMDTVTLETQLSEKWASPIRGIRPRAQTEIRKAEHLGQALAMGADHGYRTLFQIYFTLRNLSGGRLPVEEIHGPIGIFKVAFAIAKMGWPRLMMFLGFLSINLAVLNFLPIPVLDGGHMVFLIWEAVTRKRPSERVMVAATYCGFAFVVGLMVFVVYLDLFVHDLK